MFTVHVNCWPQQSLNVSNPASQKLIAKVTSTYLNDLGSMARNIVNTKKPAAPHLSNLLIVNFDFGPVRDFAASLRPDL
jgi:hypothetical protein